MRLICPLDIYQKIISLLLVLAFNQVSTIPRNSGFPRSIIRSISSNLGFIDLAFQYIMLCPFALEMSDKQVIVYKYKYHD